MATFAFVATFGAFVAPTLLAAFAALGTFIAATLAAFIATAALAAFIAAFAFVAAFAAVFAMVAFFVLAPTGATATESTAEAAARQRHRATRAEG
ncbi:MAG TPA: hypothetical protein VGI26_04130 [Solirubrobacteraceae bacterium]